MARGVRPGYAARRDLGRTSRTLRVKTGITILLAGSVYLLASCASIMGVEEPTLDPDAVLPQGTDASAAVDGRTAASDSSVADNAKIDAAPPPQCSPTIPCAGGKTCCGDVCLDLQGSVATCGACTTACSTVNGIPACTTGVCSWTCTAGYGHCLTMSSGCETKLDIPTKCGSCTNDCTDSDKVEHVNTPTCAAATLTCTYASCKSFYYDKDGNKANGCEEECGDDDEACCPAGPQCKGGLNCQGNKCK